MARLNGLHPNRLFLKLLLAFWLTSSIIAGGLILIPKLQQRDNVEPLRPFHQELLARTAQRIESLPIQDINRFANRLRRDPVRTLEPGPRHRDQLRPPHPPKGGPNWNQTRPRVYLLTPEGQLLGNRKDRQPRSVTKFLLEVDDFQAPRSVRTRDGTIFGPEPLTIQGNTYLLLMELRQPKQRNWLKFLVDNPGWFLLLTALISGVIFGFVAWHFGKPLNQLRQTALQLASGDLNARVNPKVTGRHDEVGQLAKSFDAMADSVSNLVKEQRRLLSDISHELRTPLTRIQLSLALARRKGQQSAELDRLEQQAEQMEKMIHELLQLSRLSAEAREKQTSVELNRCLDGVIDGAQFEAEQQLKHLRYHIDPKLELVGNPTLLSRAVENLLRNAIRYANEAIELTVRRNGTDIVIQVDDDGCGVDDNKLEQIFRPFKRVSEARDRQSGGWGLGLAIVQATADTHRGRVVASRSKLGGLAVTLTLPLG